MKILIQRKLQVLLVSMGLLTGCAGIKSPAAPVADNFLRSSQKQMQASQHWMMVAEDLAEQMMSNLASKKLASKPIYLNLQTNVTPFTRAFNDFLITHLVEKGVAVSQAKNNSVIYNYKIQTVQYQSNRNTLLPEKVKWTSLAGGLFVARNVASIFNADALLLGAGAVVDVEESNRAPNLELIITSSLLDRDIYLARTTDIYYVNEADIDLYKTNGSASQANVFDDPFYKTR